MKKVTEYQDADGNRGQAFWELETIDMPEVISYIKKAYESFDLIPEVVDVYIDGCAFTVNRDDWIKEEDYVGF